MAAAAAAANNDNRRRADQPVVAVAIGRNNNNDEAPRAAVEETRRRRRLLMRRGPEAEAHFMMLHMEHDHLRRLEEARRREQEEEARRVAAMVRVRRRGISSFQQEQDVFGSEYQFQPHDQEEEQATPGLEQVVASPEFDAKRLFLKRVTACVGWAVHGLVFEFMDRSRMGCLLDGFAETRLPLTDENMHHRLQVAWQNVDYGDYIVGIHGNKLHDPSLLWLCHTVVLELSSGKTICFESPHEPWRGEEFAFSVKQQQPCLIYRITFRHEQTQDMRGLMTAIHLPFSVANMKYLPAQHQETVEQILSVLGEVDQKRESHGKKALTNDLWWNILGWIRAWEMPIVGENGELCNQFQSLSASANE